MALLCWSAPRKGIYQRDHGKGEPWTTEEKAPPKEKYSLEKPIEETVLYEKTTKDIVTITLNRPEKHNAIFPPDQFNEISKKIAMAVDDDDIKCIILQGNGKSFCSGDDLNLAPYDTYGGAPGVKPSQRSPREGHAHVVKRHVSSAPLLPEDDHLPGAGLDDRRPAWRS